MRASLPKVKDLTDLEKETLQDGKYGNELFNLWMQLGGHGVYLEPFCRSLASVFRRKFCVFAEFSKRKGAWSWFMFYPFHVNPRNVDQRKPYDDLPSLNFIAYERHLEPVLALQPYVSLCYSERRWHDIFSITYSVLLLSLSETG